jgi:drug/metabolite transporter (DMT)-like permease
MLSLGLILQHVGLGLSDESVIAFLTNLTVIFVPAWVVLITRERPRNQVLAAVPIALLGMAFLVGVRSTQGAGAGASWGVACAAAFAAEIVMLDRLGRRDHPARIVLVLFVTSAVCCGALAAVQPGFGQIPWQTLAASGIWREIIPLTLLTTVAAFALMTIYQPKVDPTRAAVIYLCEPLFAAIFAWWHNGRAMSADALFGAGLILMANIIAEWRPRRLQSPA